MPERVSELMLRVEQDKQALDLVIRGLQLLEQHEHRVADVWKEITAATAPAARELREVGREAKSLDKIADAANRTKHELRDMQQQAAKTPSALEVGRTGTGVQKLAGLASNFGVGGGLQIGADLFDAVEGIQALKSELPALASQAVSAAGGAGKLAIGLGVAGAAIAAIAIGVTVLSKNSKEAENRAYAYAKALDEVSKTTTEAARNQLDALKLELTAQQNLLAEFKRLEDAAKEGPTVFSDVGFGLRDAFNLFEGEAGGFEKATEEAAARVAELEGRVRAYEEALRTGVTATNDAIAAERDLTAARLSQIDAAVQRELRFAQQRESLSVEQAQARLEEIETERDILMQAAEDVSASMETLTDQTALDQAQAALDGYMARIRELDKETEHLTATVIPLAKAREFEATMAENMRAHIENVVGAFQKIADINQQVGELREEFERTSEQIAEQRQILADREAADAALKAFREMAQFSRELAQFDAGAAEEELRALEELGDTRNELVAEERQLLKDAAKEDLRAAREHQRQLDAIQRQIERDRRDAVARLDATALLAIAERGQEQLREENETYEEARRMRAEDLADSITTLRAESAEKINAAQRNLDNLRREHAQERSEKIRAFQEQQRLEAEDRRIRLQRQQEDWAREDRARSEAFNREMDKLLGHHQNIESATTAHYGRLATIVEQGMAAVESVIRTRLSTLSNSLSSSTTTANSSNSYGGYRGLAAGGTLYPGQQAIVGEREPEIIRFMGNQVRVIPTGWGRSPVQVTIPVSIQMAGGDTVNRDVYQRLVANESRLRARVQQWVIDLLESA